MGRTLATIDPLAHRTTLGYDPVGRVIRQTNPLGNISTTVYDAAGRIRVTINPLALRTTFSYDAADQQIAVTDANTNRTTTVYDAAGRALAGLDALNFRTTTVYDKASRPIALLDPRGNRNTFAFDAASQKIQQQDPLGNRITYGYDPAGQNTLRIDARGNRTTYAFDPVGNLTGRRYPDGSRVTQVFDPVANRTRMQDGTGRYTFAYDPLNRNTLVVNSNAKRVSYAYDAIGQRSSLTDPDGGRFTYAFDAAGRMTDLVNPQGDRTSYTYDAADRTLVKLRANGTRCSYTYDNADRLTRIVDLKSTGATISSFLYRYDHTVHRTSALEASGDRVTWSYDATYQLLNEIRIGLDAYNVTYTYDPLGNRLLKVDSGSSTTYAYDAANRMLTSEDGTGTTTFSYDASGNQRQVANPDGTVTTYTWNFESKLTQGALSASNVVTYVYNGDLQRVKRTDAAEVQQYVWDRQNTLLETDGSGLTQVVYTLQPAPFGNLVSQNRLDMGVWVASYYHYDALGSTDSLTDSAQVITDTYLYKAFGELVTSTGTTDNPYQYVGQQGYVNDPVLALLDLRARPYRARTSQFLSADPLFPFPDVNPYRYVTNDPANETDPSGMQTEHTPYPPIRGGTIGAGGRFCPQSGKPNPEQTWKDVDEFYRTQLPRGTDYTTFSKGCIGLCQIRTGTGDKTPQNFPGTKCFSTAAAAEDFYQQGVKGGKRPVLYAIQGTKLPPELQDSTGSQLSRVDGKQIAINNIGDYNYATSIFTYYGPAWEWINQGWASGGAGPNAKANAYVKHREKLPPGIGSGARFVPFAFTYYCVKP